MRNLLLLLVFVSSTVSQAQINFGGKVGANLSNFIGDDADDAKSKFGFNVGVLAEIPIASTFAVKPELVFSTQGSKTETGSDKYIFRLDYFNLPVLIKYKTSSGFITETGPQLGLLIGAKAVNNDVESDVKNQFTTTDFSWAFGLGYEIADYGFGINFRYNLGLSDIAEGDNSNLKNSVYQLGVYRTFTPPARARRK